MSMRWARVALLLSLVCGANVLAGDGDGVGGIGILGDSYSDEYQFYAPHRSAARNWVEILATARGLDFGELCDEPRDEPRNQGFAYNWARSAATTDDMIASGQHTGLAGQVASGQVRLAVIFIGGNDFIQALHSSSPAEHLRGCGERAAANVGRALETLLAASPAAKVLLITVPDLADLPEFREKIRAGLLNRSVWDQAAAELEGFNSRIRRMGVAKGRVAVLDFADLPGFDAGLSPILAGRRPQGRSDEGGQRPGMPLPGRRAPPGDGGAGDARQGDRGVAERQVRRRDRPPGGSRNPRDCLEPGPSRRGQGRGGHDALIGLRNSRSWRACGTLPRCSCLPR